MAVARSGSLLVALVRGLVPGLLLGLVPGAVGCGAAGGPPPSAVEPPRVAPDPFSHAEPARVRVKHVSLALDLDFDARQARATAELTLERFDPAAPLLLDSQGLLIDAVSGLDGRPRAFSLGVEDPILGSALRIDLGPDDRVVRIRYRTTERSAALQWLTPAQTGDGKKPFLLTQGQSILTRTWIPLQDSPGVRITYDATVRAPVGLTAVMSAEQLGRGADGAWRFRMAQPIPSYLIALACGDIAFAPISERSGVWAEPSLLDAARAELADTETMIVAAEALFGPYRWGRYDLIVLPPSFPFGGMENPRLTFVTPTILAGDKSLVSLVAHELAHSWSGNLVTNATWRDFWLNEGFTSYFEQRIIERVYGVDRTNLEKQLARNGLEKALLELEPWAEVLHVDLRGRRPDDAGFVVPYDKGALFLQRLEVVFGRERFDRFLRGYFDANAFTSITTADLVRSLRRDLLADDPAGAAAIDLDLWLERPGLPADAPRIMTTALERVDRERGRWLAGTGAAALDTAGWVTQQWQHFIRGMPAGVPVERLGDLDRAFHFTAARNSEILSDWLLLALKRGYAPADARLEEFLLGVGRLKFLRPLYAALAVTEKGRERARAIYSRARPRYHAVATRAIDEILAPSPGASRAK